MDVSTAPWPVLAIGTVLGLIVGSFLNVVIHRLPRDESVVWPGSRCPTCGASVRPWDNLPVVSWVVLRGRCRDCGAAISARYPVIEALCGALFLAILVRYGVTLDTLLYWVFAAMLLAAAWIDFDHQIIPDELSLGGLALGLVAVPALGLHAGLPAGEALRPVLEGALLGGGILWVVGFVHARLSVAFGRTFPHWPGEGEDPPRFGTLDYWTWFPGLGFGDVKLLAMVGAFLGPAGVLETIFASAVLGLVLGLAVLIATRDSRVPFGFGPAIVAGALAVLLSPVHWIVRAA